MTTDRRLPDYKKLMRHDVIRSCRAAEMTPQQIRLMQRLCNRAYGYGYAQALDHHRREIYELLEQEMPQ